MFKDVNYSTCSIYLSNVKFLKLHQSKHICTQHHFFLSWARPVLKEVVFVTASEVNYKSCFNKGIYAVI